MDARRAKAGKYDSTGMGRGVAGSSSTAIPYVTGDETMMMPPPRAAASKGKAVRTPSFYDVDRCARWETPLVDEEARAASQGLPVLPRACKSQGFGVI